MKMTLFKINFPKKNIAPPLSECPLMSIILQIVTLSQAMLNILDWFWHQEHSCCH